MITKKETAMWKRMKISEQTYFIYCNFNESTQDLTFILYDFKITWSQTINFKDVKLKVRLLNKRFDFNEDNIKEALTSDSIQCAVLGEPSSLESCSLKLKYRVKNCLLSYEWCLRKQNLLEFQQTIVQPLLLTLLECQQQINILADNVRKKDIELKQFRIEGAVLNRKTLVTKPFDFDDFNIKFVNCNKTTHNFKELAEYVKAEHMHAGPEVIDRNLNENSAEKNSKPEENAGEDPKVNIKMSPRQKKRKANEMKMDRLQQHLKLRRIGLEYDSSQSQTPSSCSSQTVEEDELKTSKPTRAKEPENSKQENLLSPRKSTRCAAVKQTQQKISSDDKTDSDYDGHLRAPAQKRIGNSLDSRKSVSSRNSNDQKTKANCNNVSLQETKLVTLKKSQSLLNDTRKKASGECISSSVFDYSTESDDDTPLLERKKLPKTRNGHNFQKANDKTPTNNTLLSLNNKSPICDVNSPNAIMSASPNNSLSHSSTPVIINEISSQLDNIKKELETLEAMRLADLQQRMCKL